MRYNTKNTKKHTNKQNIKQNIKDKIKNNRRTKKQQSSKKYLLKGGVAIPKTLSIATYNIFQGGCKDFGKSFNDGDPGELIKKQAHIVCTQEDPHNNNKGKFGETFKADFNSVKLCGGTSTETVGMYFNTKTPLGTPAAAPAPAAVGVAAPAAPAVAAAPAPAAAVGVGVAALAAPAAAPAAAAAPPPPPPPPPAATMANFEIKNIIYKECIKTETSLDGAQSRNAVIINYQGIKIANLHLEGGGNVDKVLTDTNFQDYLKYKKELLELVIAEDPDIILGDFNSVHAEGVADLQGQFIKDQEKYYKKELTISNINNWNSLDQIIDLKNINGTRKYKYVDPFDNNLSGIAAIPSVLATDNAKATYYTNNQHITNYKGKSVIDLIWYKTGDIIQKATSCNIINLQKDKQFDKNNCISDHNPVLASFEIDEANLTKKDSDVSKIYKDKLDKIEIKINAAVDNNENKDYQKLNDILAEFDENFGAIENNAVYKIDNDKTLITNTLAKLKINLDKINTNQSSNTDSNDTVYTDSNDINFDELTEEKDEDLSKEGEHNIFTLKTRDGKIVGKSIEFLTDDFLSLNPFRKKSNTK